VVSAASLGLARAPDWLLKWSELVIHNLPPVVQLYVPMSTRTYGQYCGLACALELVGERWALLIVRDLVLGPKRFSELRRGLPRIPSNVLSTRLRELEGSGVVRRRLEPYPSKCVVYELTESGRELEDIVIQLGIWGAKTMREPRAGDTLSRDSLLLGLRALFHPDAARGLKADYELRLDGIVAHARIAKGAVDVGEGSLEDPDLVVESDFSLRSVLAGELELDEAVASGKLRFVGDRKLLERFVEIFSIAPVPASVAA
jgi:DNA-binding HxlR family transcriptional regulator